VANFATSRAVWTAKVDHNRRRSHGARSRSTMSADRNRGKAPKDLTSHSREPLDHSGYSALIRVNQRLIADRAADFGAWHVDVAATAKAMTEQEPDAAKALGRELMKLVNKSAPLYDMPNAREVSGKI
jgi:hypothetical protein